MGSIETLRIAACMGQLRGLVSGKWVEAYDAALVSMSEGDMVPVFGLLARANLGLKGDHPAREVVLEAWALLEIAQVGEEVAA
jgi:hypothetical protein